MFDHPRFGKKGRVSFWASAMLSDAIVSVCDDADRYMKRKFRLPKKKFFVVDNGIELDPFLAVPRRVPHEELVFGFAGRMAPEKNHHVLLDAFSLFSRKHANVRLRILGGGTLDAQIREQARKLQLDPIVEFCGFSHDVPGFLATLDVYVLPSKYEALPLSLLEAIASGLPAVATTVGAVPDIIENTQGGWLCPPDDPQALCAAMEVALASHDRIERGERARRLVSERYSASRMTRDYETVYQKFLRKSLSIPA
jgi:glycosyltransferase involved in cell wall biosynthesis